MLPVRATLKNPRHIAIAMSLGVAVGCADSEPDGDFTSTRDSAGVLVVHYRLLPQNPPHDIVLGAEPRLVIGADPDDELFNVVGAVRLSDGRIVVGNGGIGELRYYGENGKLVRVVGKTGEGPGEFRALMWLGVLPGDSVITADRELRRFQVFGPSGDLHRSAPVSTIVPAGFLPPRPVGVLSNGSLVGALSNLPTHQAPGPQRNAELVGLLSPGETTWDSITVVPGAEQLVEASDQGFRMTAYTFGSYADVAAGGARIALMDAGTLGFLLFSPDGRARARLEIEQPRRAVTRELLAAHAEDMLSKWPPGPSESTRNDFRRRIVEGPHAADLPGSRAIEVDRAGRTWLEVYSPPGSAVVRFLVFGPEAEYLGSVEMPPGIERGTHPGVAPALDIGEDYILGVWTDENGVETVRLYDLTIELRT